MSYVSLFGSHQISSLWSQQQSKSSVYNNKAVRGEAWAPLWLFDYFIQDLLLLFGCSSKPNRKHFSTLKDLKRNPAGSWIFIRSNISQLRLLQTVHQYYSPPAPPEKTDCLSFRAGSHSLPCHKYLLSLVHSSAFNRSLWVFSEIVWSAPGLSFQRTDHRRPDPAVSWTAEKTTADKRQRGDWVMWDRASPFKAAFGLY